jgi:hypothetical protein
MTDEKIYKSDTDGFWHTKITLGSEYDCSTMEVRFRTLEDARIFKLTASKALNYIPDEDEFLRRHRKVVRVRK